LVWAFLIAAVIVSPYAFVTARRILGERRERDALDHPPEPDAPIGPPEEHDIARVLGELRTAALAHPRGEAFDLPVPPGTTVGGRLADPTLVVRLAVDDLRRSGVEVDDPGAGTTLRCRLP
jgi:hypothetical protein